MHHEEIKSCRICHHEDFVEIFDFGDVASCGYFPESANEKVPSAPMVLIRCKHCLLVQLKHNYRQDDLFRHTYGYRSGLNETMKSHLQGIVDETITFVDVKPGDIVLDIGSNDCTLLKAYGSKDLQRIGIDPTSDQFKEFYPDEITRVGDFFTSQAFRNVFPTQQATIITSIAMFYDLPDPNEFVEDIADVLAEDGVWVFEQSYLPTMLKKKSFDTVCHEHLEYYGLSQLITLLRRHKMRIFNVEFNEINGGSFRLYACHESAHFPQNAEKINHILESEKEVEPLLSGFAHDIENTKNKVLSLLKEYKDKGQKVHGYGASTKGNTLLQYCGITADLIEAIADRNPVKWGTYTPGTTIPIISEADSRAANPDYFFVLPWHFKNEFLVREDRFRKNGGKLIFPLPEIEIS